MNHQLSPFVVGIALIAPAILPATAAPSAAKEWYQNEMDLAKRCTGILKSVKNKASADKAGKALERVFAKPKKKDKDVGLGTPSKEAPKGDEAEKELKKIGKRRDKINKALNTEKDRIVEASFYESEELKKVWDQIPCPVVLEEEKPSE